MNFKWLKLLFIVACILLQSCANKERVKDLKVNVINIKETMIEENEISCGIFEPNKKIKISSLVSGKITTRPLTGGMLVNKNEILFIIDNPEINLNLKEAIAQKKETEEKLSKAIEDVKKAKIEAEKVLISIENQKLSIVIKENEINQLEEKTAKKMKLLEIGGIAGSEIKSLNERKTVLGIELKILQNRLESSLCGISRKEIKKEFKKEALSSEQLHTLRIIKLSEDSKQRVKSIQALLKMAEINQLRADNLNKQLIVRSPTHGVIESIQVQNGEVIQAGTAMATLSVNSKLLAHFSVPIRSIKKFTPNSSVLFKVIDSKIESKQVEGKILSNSSAINPATGEIGITALIDNKKRSLFAGDYFEISYSLSNNKSGWIVPTTALTSFGGKTTIHIVFNNKIQIKEVTYTNHNEGNYLIQGDLSKEFLLVDFPNESLKEGTKVISEVSNEKIALSD